MVIRKGFRPDTTGVGVPKLCAMSSPIPQTIHVVIMNRAENVMLRFSSKIRCLAASDKLIALDGVSGYVQTVLVPELAVLLVKDDMGVNEDCAREILRDTVDIGNLLNEEEDEIIHDPSPDLEVKREVVVEVS